MLILPKIEGKIQNEEAKEILRNSKPFYDIYVKNQIKNTLPNINSPDSKDLFEEDGKHSLQNKTIGVTNKFKFCD